MRGTYCPSLSILGSANSISHFSQNWRWTISINLSLLSFSFSVQSLQELFAEPALWHVVYTAHLYCKVRDREPGRSAKSSAKGGTQLRHPHRVGRCGIVHPFETLVFQGFHYQAHQVISTRKRKDLWQFCFTPSDCTLCLFISSGALVFCERSTQIQIFSKACLEFPQACVIKWHAFHEPCLPTLSWQVCYLAILVIEVWHLSNQYACFWYTSWKGRDWYSHNATSSQDNIREKPSISTIEVLLWKCADGGSTCGSRSTTAGRCQGALLQKDWRQAAFYPKHPLPWPTLCLHSRLWFRGPSVW